MPATQSWKQFNIAQCVAMIKDAIDELRPSTLNASWKKLWPDIVTDFSNIPTRESEIEQSLQSSDVEEVLNLHDCELTETELLELLEDQSSGEHENEETATSMTKSLTLSDLNKTISTA
ncbi:hypothetical protein QE152_g22568 [Popillia japonica]|uniref:Uncharacterized protein n=1 Tax=Popillia japonica TaxID=7064 RepID=A0AAW1KLQ8_POPJA